jgi:hypothetical protein
MADSSFGLAASLLLDDQHPWPGLTAFSEADRAFFHGRDEETEELLNLVLRERLTLLFGKSGIGKTSLLLAGLIPRMRQRDLLPVYLRLDCSDGAPAFRDQIISAIAREADASQVERPPVRAGESLWEYFHRQDYEFWSPLNRLLTPVLVFDQFEEVFTLGRQRKTTGTLLEEFATLAGGYLPETIRARLEQEPGAADRFSFKRYRYRILLSIREDFLPELEDIRSRIPFGAEQRFRLLPLAAAQALEAVLSSGRQLIEPEVAERLIRFLASGNPSEALSQLEVEPALISVLLRELNHRRVSRGLAQIADDLPAEGVLAGYYHHVLADLGPEVRAFVEDHLVTTSGYRLSFPLEDALALPGVTRQTIDQLVERRLLRIDDRFDHKRVELVHDVLTATISASRERKQA